MATGDRTKLRIASMFAAALVAVSAAVVLPSGVAQALPVSSNFTVAPTVLAFPSTFVGASSAIDVVITNVSAVPQSPSFTGGGPFDPANFSVYTNCGGVTLAPGATCRFFYSFNPASTGPHTSSTTIGINAEMFPITMSGSGLYPFTVAPTNLAFPDTAVGATSAIDVVVTNISGVPQTVTLAGGAPLDSVNFGGSQNCAGATLAPGASCRLFYTFHPATIGPHVSTTSVDINSQSFPISLSGTGVVAPTTTTTTTTTTPVTTTTTTPVTTTTTTPVTTTTSGSATSTTTFDGGGLPATGGSSSNLVGIWALLALACGFGMLRIARTR